MKDEDDVKEWIAHACGDFTHLPFVHSHEGRRRRRFGLGEVDWVCWQLIISSTLVQLSSSPVQLRFSLA